MDSLGDPSASLRQAMASDGISQVHLARLTGISQSTISRYLSGGVRPGPDHERRLIDALPTLRRLSEERGKERKSALLADAQATSEHLLVPRLPSGFNAHSWDVTYTERGFPEAYRLVIVYQFEGQEYVDSVRVLYGAEPSACRSTILEETKKTVEALRDRVGVIA